ncbi:hypothetical protein [Bacillus cereus group sp. BfR-BA-01347]|uniref:hypothetical protein n=1 Tax=Bacillus cereus group sp. BfR-BA-01347 TaxID=2920310 RepID=UPI001F569069|nr:hypothetical protein [Bacillus cereus group sp. BfR-BA-01347]
MKNTIGNVSNSFIIRLILDDLDKYVTEGERQFDFCSESDNSSVMELIRSVIFFEYKFLAAICTAAFLFLYHCLIFVLLLHN